MPRSIATLASRPVWSNWQEYFARRGCRSRKSPLQDAPKWGRRYEESHDLIASLIDGILEETVRGGLLKFDLEVMSWVLALFDGETTNLDYPFVIF